MARARVVFPSGAAVDPATARLLVETIEHQAPLPGLPAATLDAKRITVSLAIRWPQGADGRAYPDRALIVLPRDSALAWAPSKLHRVIRHELAHIGLAAFLGYSLVPGWFDEGFAEWAAGGPTCEGETRIRLELALRRHHGRPLPEIRGPGALGRSRVSYDLFATLFEYVDQEWRNVVSDGTLLEAVQIWGVEAGLSRTVRLDLKGLVEAWQSYLLKRFDGDPFELTCLSQD